MDMLLSFRILFFVLPFSFCVDLMYRVEESKNARTYLGDIAKDSHLLDRIPVQVQDQVTFSQLQGGSLKTLQLFNVTKTGKLYTAQSLDAENLCTYNTECFKMVDIAVRQEETFIKILKVKILVEDINDHSPEFPQEQISLEFSETDGKGTSSLIPNAIDKDVGLFNSQITYQLEDSLEEPFTLSVSKRVDGTATLEIVLKERLDREAKDSYMLQVVAKDGGFPSRKSILKVHIAVNDVNDNRPVFPQSIYNISIKNTHQMNVPVLTLSATDLDFGKNSKVSYYFSSKISDVARLYFQLNKEDGRIYLWKKLPAGQKKNYKLFVEARDGGRPPLSSIALVFVNVINQQNNAPEIDINFVSALVDNTATISEKIKVGSFIAFVKIIDNDFGQNGEVSCDLHHEKFQLRSLASKEYKVILKSLVNREAEDHYDIKITCEDMGQPPLKAQRQFSIQVMDVNDVQPQFTKKTFKFLTYENEELNFPVGFINATDPDLDSGGKLSYHLVSENKDKIPFQITNYGFISTIESLDYEQNNNYKFQVLVKDNGNPQLNNTANVIVEVMDENDNAPYFTFPSVNPFSLDVYYHPQSENDITTLRASDRDSRENAFLHYEILGGNDRQLFTVNPYTGAMSFSRTVYQNDAGLYNLQLIVKDSGTPVLSTSTALSLTLTVSNKTSKMFTAVNTQADNRIHLNLVIVITLAAVIVSVAVVVSIIICIVRCHNVRNTQHITETSSPNQSRSEKGHLISHANNLTALTLNSDETRNSTTASMMSKTQLYQEDELPVEWNNLNATRSLPRAAQMYIPQAAVTSGGRGFEENTFMSPDCWSDMVFSHVDTGHCWTERDFGQYEEIPAHKRTKTRTLSTSGKGQN
ncbi:protocadherin beta-15 isoform X2 [Octopus bimaculoides]|uniref:protocadherin beta-15 isoform X2 n=1 Tax=Octopus bimaculoides TaxID=37653 RepID=UPI00071D8EC8|nr:protocadherin beta-15 isoform X2 [Octopus bimaculoides]|eukprot:XP_014784415.1 PREDICTED: protocadherin beta-15-like isoform X2 [Octopus bimaculoides]